MCHGRYALPFSLPKFPRFARKRTQKPNTPKKNEQVSPQEPGDEASSTKGEKARPNAPELASSTLYYDSNSSLESALNSADDRTRSILEKLRQPTGIWLLDDLSWLDATFEKAGDKKLVLVAYNINDRDCSGAHSAGGAADANAYRSWASGLASIIGDRDPVVILEPDALPDANACPNTSERLASLRFFVSELKSRTNASVYLDSGNSGWKSAEEMSELLREAGVDQADGIALNTSNYKNTQDEEAYGRRILSLIGLNKGMVIDTSRNGNGPPPNGEWCNPEGRRVGVAPRLLPGSANVDAYLWVKKPGESDGTVGYGNCGDNWIPSPFYTGQFNLDIALSLAGEDISQLELTPDEGTCQQHKEWGNCSADWMVQNNLCANTCSR